MHNESEVLLEALAMLNYVTLLWPCDLHEAHDLTLIDAGECCWKHLSSDSRQTTVL